MKHLTIIIGHSMLLAGIILTAGCSTKSDSSSGPTGSGTIPVVVTGTYSNVLINTVDVTGNVTSDGGSAVTRRGFCSSQSNQNPTIQNDTMVASGNGTGTFTGTVKGLRGQTLSYIRAYSCATFFL